MTWRATPHGPAWVPAQPANPLQPIQAVLPAVIDRLLARAEANSPAAPTA